MDTKDAEQPTLKNFTFSDAREGRTLDVDRLGYDREDAAKRFEEMNGFHPDTHPWPDHMFETPRPKPAPPKPKVTISEVAEAFKEMGEAAEKGAEAVAKTLPKREFVRKPHLTERPFQSHPGLQELQKNLAPKKKPVNKRRGQSRTNKEKK